MEPDRVRSHALTLTDRNLLDVTGVTKVESFDDREIVLITHAGRLTVRGASMHIRHLDLQTGSCVLDGQVASLVYAQGRAQQGRGWAQRLGR